MHTPNDVLMGAQPGQMNLRAIRRADELRKTIDQLLQALQFDPASLQW